MKWRPLHSVAKKQMTPELVADLEQKLAAITARRDRYLELNQTARAEQCEWRIEDFEQQLESARSYLPTEGSLLNFDVPKKVKHDYGFEDGPTGGYMPQMGDEDRRRWKAKKFNIGKENARIELRRSMPGGVSGRGDATQVHIIVALDGWDYSKKFESREENPKPGKHWNYDTRGLNVRMSMNGPLLMTFELFNEINQIVTEARTYLEKETT